MRNRIEKLIGDRTRDMLELQSHIQVSGNRKQISLRPDAVTLCQIDTLAEILDQSRQHLMDELLEAAMMDAIDAYCDAHGPDHAEQVRSDFVLAFKQRWDDLYAEGEE